jgi:hypothetical protein
VVRPSAAEARNVVANRVKPWGKIQDGDYEMKKPRRSNKRAAHKAKAGKQNRLDKAVADFSRRFSQIRQQYERAEPSTKFTLRTLCMYSGLIEAVINAVTKIANKSISPEELAKHGIDAAMPPEEFGKRGIYAADRALVVWLMKAGFTPLKPELTKAQSRAAAEIAVQDLKANAELISLSALEGNEWFFIYLGKFLSGEMDTSFPERLDFDVWDILSRNPSIRSPDAVHELKKLGWTMTEDAFRMRRKRLGAEFTRRFSRHSKVRKA